VTRNRSSAKAAGSSFEKQQADAWAWHLKDDRIERRVTNGARDRGDIGGVRTPSGQRVVIECKNTATLALAAWVREAQVEAVNDSALLGIVVHKKRGTTDPLEQYVTMTVRDVLLLGWGVSPRVREDAPHPEYGMPALTGAVGGYGVIDE
jgi:hypothetical protein